MYTLVFFADAEEKKKKLSTERKKVVAKKPAKKKEEPKPTKKKPTPVAKVSKEGVFERNKGLENEYRRKLLSVSNNIHTIVSKYDENDPKSAKKIVSDLKKYSNNLKDWAKSVAVKLVYGLNNDDRWAWGNKSTLLSRSLKLEVENVPIEPLLRRYMDDQVGLITSLPLHAAKRIQNMVLENLKTGKYRSKGLARIIEETWGVSKSKAQLIARTEISRMSTGLERARSESIGLDWYIWRSTKDIRLRESHKFMDGVVIKWSDPPNPEKLSGKNKPYGAYHAGSTFNCRCYADPIISIDDISFPARVHRNGSIVAMGKSEFLRLFDAQIKSEKKKAA